VRAVAARNPDTLVIGVDANVDALRATSRRFAAKPSRGGLSNALLARLSLADAPGELAGLADALTVLLPWRSLLAAVARPDVAALRALRAFCKPGAQVHVVFGYEGDAERAAIQDLALPPLDSGTLTALESAYRQAGFVITARFMALEEVRALPTTWAKRLTYTGRERTFVELDGRAWPSIVRESVARPTSDPA
jgi:hypothetical protein